MRLLRSILQAKSSQFPFNGCIILGVSLDYKKRNEVIRKTLGVACISDKIREVRLIWYGHVMKIGEENSMKRIMTAEVNGCDRIAPGTDSTSGQGDIHVDLY